MPKVTLVCPECENEMQKNVYEIAGLDEADFIPIESHSKLNINLKLGKFSFGQDTMIHALVKDTYHCPLCKKIIVDYRIER